MALGIQQCPPTWIIGQQASNRIFGIPRESRLSLTADGYQFVKREYIYGRFALGNPYATEELYKWMEKQKRD